MKILKLPIKLHFQRKKKKKNQHQVPDYFLKYMQSLILHTLDYYKEKSNRSNPTMNPEYYEYHESLEPQSQPLEDY